MISLRKIYNTRWVRVFRFYFPLTRIRPVNSFCYRLVQKIDTILRWAFFYKFNFSGAKEIGIGPSGNIVLEINRSSELGQKGDRILVPYDQVIFRNVVRLGAWEKTESNFLSGLAFENRNEKLVFIDIGGQAGLISRQFLAKSSEYIFYAWIVEPIDKHVSAIKYNLEKWIKSNQVGIYPYAIDSTSSKNLIHTANDNSGNSSLLDYLPPNRPSSTSEILTKSAQNFESMFYSPAYKFLIKCDIQGMDAKVLSLFSKPFWSQTLGCVVEIWALPSVNEEHVEMLMDLWQSFNHFSWDISLEIKTNLQEVKDFWLSGSGATRNLFITKSN